MRRIETATEGVRELASLLEGSRRAVVFTGAGISTESGIPDFRSPGGIWTKHRPIDFAQFLASEEARREAWRRKFALDATLSRAVPNRGHRAVAELVRRGRVETVITQNIDGLHQASGVPDAKIVELHGNTTYARCLGCGRRYELQGIRAEFTREERPPRCGSCGGHVKTATISFGQPMPEEAMARAAEATLACDLFLAVGSSLVVHPAAAFPVVAKRNGARLAILNRDPTDLDEAADVVMNLQIGPTLGAAVGIE
jgi:NAD-dependent protein deacetylase/lipoamidase